MSLGIHDVRKVWEGTLESRSGAVTYRLCAKRLGYGSNPFAWFYERQTRDALGQVTWVDEDDRCKEIKDAALASLAGL